MSLPVRGTIADVTAVSRYLASKPTGATTADAKRVLDAKHLDTRKVSALKAWGFVSDDNGRMKVTETGRLVIKDEAGQVAAFRQVVRGFEPYMAVLERAAHRNETSLTATEIAAHWHEHYPGEASDNDDILNDQAICFLQAVEGAGLGTITVGRRGASTRIDLALEKVTAFVEADPGSSGFEITHEESVPINIPIGKTTPQNVAPSILSGQRQESSPSIPKNDRVFITHGKNDKIVSQLKEIVTFGRFKPIVAEEHETVSKPVPDKVLDEMRACFAGIIHVAGERVLIDDAGNKHHVINENVLIEIGAALALYGRNVILLVEKGVQLPSNLQGLYECRYEGDKLDGDATMKLLKAFNDFSTGPRP